MNTVVLTDSFPRTRIDLMIENEIRKQEGRPPLKVFHSKDELDTFLEKAKAQSGKPMQVEDYRRYPYDIGPVIMPRTYMYGW